MLPYTPTGVTSSSSSNNNNNNNNNNSNNGVHYLILPVSFYRKQLHFVNRLDPCVKLTDFYPSVGGAFETMLYIELRKTITNAAR